MVFKKIKGMTTTRPVTMQSAGGHVLKPGLLMFQLNELKQHAHTADLGDLFSTKELHLYSEHHEQLHKFSGPDGCTFLYQPTARMIVSAWLACSSTRIASI